MFLHETNQKPIPDGKRAAASPAVAGYRPLALALALAACFAAAPLRAQTAGAQAIHGAATLSRNGANLTVTTQNGPGTSHSAINWQSFNVPGGSTTHFAQPNAASTSINRVLGNNPSAIFGTLSSNGKLVLVNPSGIAVGAGAVVDTAGFTASTLRMSDADALAGRMRFGQDGLGGGSLSVQGRVVARGGDVVLIAPQVDTGAQAVVQASGGDTLLVAGQKVALTGRGLEGIHLELQAPADRALNLGTLKGDSVGVFASQLRHSGLVQASSASLQGGKVVLRGQGSADVAGQVTAQRGTGAGVQGGAIHVTAAQTTLGSTAVLDASGPAGGGEVLVGGAWQGKGPLANAQQTTAEAGSTVRADATLSGNGGTVVLWSDGLTRTAARISARGGPQGGNGGRVETSGKTLVRRGAPDVGAPRGKAGTWLLDPDYILISQGEPGEPGLGDGSIAATDPGSVTQVYQGEIQGFNGDIVLEANHAIVAEGETSFNLYVNGNLTLRTVNATEPPVSPPLPFASTTKGIDLSRIDTLQVKASDGDAHQVLIHAGTAPTPVSGVKLKLNDIDTSSYSYSGGMGGGAVTLRSAGDLWVGNITTNHFGTVAGSGGNVTVEAKSGHVRVGAINTTVGSNVWEPEPGMKAGDITINGKTILLTGDIHADGYADRSAGAAPGSITIKAGWGCGGGCAGLDTLVIGEPAEVPLNPDSAMLPMTYGGPAPIVISALSGHASVTGEPVDGGTIVLEAMAGNIRFEADQYVEILANGRENYLTGNGLTSSNGGTVRVKALAGSITGGSLNIDVSGGHAADENGDGIPAGRNGGNGGTAEVSAATGIALANSLVIAANGGDGGRITTEPMGPLNEPPAPVSVRAGDGGNGGSITVSTASGSLLDVALTTDLRANGGAGGGAGDYLELSEGTLGAGGQGGSITVKAPTLAFHGGAARSIEALGGAGGADNYGSLPDGLGGTGGMVDLEATSASGEIYFGSACHLVSAIGYNDGQPFSGIVHLRAGSGGVAINGSSLLVAGSVHLDSPNGQPNMLGNVNITGNHEIREIYGPVTNPSVSQGESGGSGPASLTLQTKAATLRLGGGNSRALTVAGDISITMLSSDGRSNGGTLVIADTVQSQNGSITLHTNDLKLASGDTAEKLVAAGGAVNIVSGNVIRFSTQTHLNDPDSASELILNSDEIARMDTPVLRVHNYLYEAPYNESVVFGASAAAPAPTTTAGPAPAPVDRVMFNGPGVLSPGKTVSIDTNLKVAQTEPFSVDRMHISAGAVDLPLANLFGPNTEGGRGWFSADVFGFGPDLYDGEQAAVRLRNAALGTLELSPQDTGSGGFNYYGRGVHAVSNIGGGEGGMVPMVQIAAVDDNGYGHGNIEIGQPGIESGHITLQAKHIYNKGISGDMAQGGLLRTVTLDSANTVPTGEISISLLASGDIGKAAPNGYINVHAASDEGQTRIQAHGGSGVVDEVSQVALYFPVEVPYVSTSMLDINVGGSNGEAHIQSAAGITVDSDFAPAFGKVVLQAGRRAGAVPHDSGVLTVSDGFVVGGLEATTTVMLEGARVNIGDNAAVYAYSTVQIEALGTGETSGDITLSPLAWISSNDKVVLRAHGSILGNGYGDGMTTQITAPRVWLDARKSIYTYVDTTELVAGDAPENVTGPTDAIDLVLTNTGPVNLRGVGNADGLIRIRAPNASLVTVSGNIPTDDGSTEPEGGIVGKSVTMEVAGDLHVGRRIKATDNAGSGVSLTAGNVILIGHLDNYTNNVHVTSETDINLTAQSIYIRHTAGNPTGPLAVTVPESPTVMVKAGPTGMLNATALSDETFEVNATNTGGVSTQAGGGMSITSPTILYVGGSGPNQFALATSPTRNFSTVPVFTPGTGLNSFAQAGAVLPVFVPPPAPGPGPSPTPAPTPPAPPAPTPPAPPTPTPPAPPAPTPPAPPAPTPPAPPAPAPAPAPAPTSAPSSAPAVERIVEVLRSDTSVTRAEVQAIVNEVDNTVTKFVALLIQEETKQAEDKRKDDEKKKKETVAATDPQQCK